jgi:hypothetical protein
MRTAVIVILMLITVITAIGGFASASRAGGSAALCGVSFVTGLLFLILAARNGRKQKEEQNAALVRAMRESKR